MDIIKIIQENSLTVRCLPYEVVDYWTYREGDENIKYVDNFGNPIDRKVEVVIQYFDLDHFIKNAPIGCEPPSTPEQRYERFKKSFPNGRKLLKETKTVEKGGWWYVKETKNTNSMIEFSRKYDKFFAPTLEEAIKLYLDSKVK